MGNPNHDEKGRFASGSSSGAASGDHQSVSPSPTHRNVSGQAIPRSRVIARHNGADSVGTGGNGSGGDGASFPVRARLKDFKGRQTTRGPGAIARERVALNQRVDESHYPTRSNADVGLNTTLGKPSKTARGWPYNN